MSGIFRVPVKATYDAQSIFPDCITREKTRGLLKLEVPVEFESIHTVRIHQDGTLTHQSDEAKFQEASLSTLPPILLSILIPPMYPLLEPAQILSIRVTHFWLPNTTGLLRSLNEMWQPGEGVLYDWVEYLRTGNFLSAMELAAGDKDIECVYHQSLIWSVTYVSSRLWHPAPLVLVASLKSYESLTRSTQFNNNAYLCTICFMTHKGSKCLQLSCSHTFCRACLADYWKLCIAEGDVGKVGCADPGCVKEGREARLEEVARVVTEEEVRRWKWLREKRMYENGEPLRHLRGWPDDAQTRLLCTAPCRFAKPRCPNRAREAGVTKRRTAGGQGLGSVTAAAIHSADCASGCGEYTSMAADGC